MICPAICKMGFNTQIRFVCKIATRNSRKSPAQVGPAALPEVCRGTAQPEKESKWTRRMQEPLTTWKDVAKQKKKKKKVLGWSECGPRWCSPSPPPPSPAQQNRPMRQLSKKNLPSPGPSWWWVEEAAAAAAQRCGFCWLTSTVTASMSPHDAPAGPQRGWMIHKEAARAPHLPHGATGALVSSTALRSTTLVFSWPLLQNKNRERKKKKPIHRRLKQGQGPKNSRKKERDECAWFFTACLLLLLLLPLILFLTVQPQPGVRLVGGEEPAPDIL